MPVNPISSGNQQLFGGANAIMGKDDFLKILIAQLQHQDPTNPMEGQEFAAQLAQFSSLEQLQNMNVNLESVMELNLALNRTINNTMATTFIGKEVRALGSRVVLEDEKAATLNYELALPASKVTVVIRDQNGNIVRTLELKDGQAGRRQLQWDGKDDNGQTLPAGQYQFGVVAEDAGGNSVPVQTYIVGEIQGVRYHNGDAVFILGDLEVSLSDVLEINSNTNEK